MSKTAFVFPGQGSQYPGMGRELAANFPQARELFEQAGDCLGFNLARLCFEGPESDLQLTANTQPAILTVSVAAQRVVFAETGMAPDLVAGHSLGEYSALVCAGALSFEDAVLAVRQRGQFMQAAVPVGVGTMAAIIGLDRSTLEEVCQQAAEGDVVAPANYNSPGQVVIAGHVAAVERAMALARERGAKRALPLPVSAPFHCSLMQPAALRLAEVLAPLSIGSMQVPVVSNVEAVAYDDGSRVRDLLVSQVSSPVRWEESVEHMSACGVERFVEIGPGKVLSGLVKRIAQGVVLANVQEPADLKEL